MLNVLPIMPLVLQGTEKSCAILLTLIIGEGLRGSKRKSRTIKRLQKKDVGVSKHHHAAQPRSRRGALTRNKRAKASASLVLARLQTPWVQGARKAASSCG